MLERRPAAQQANLGLVAALVLILIGGAALLLGPGSRLLDRSERHLESVRERLDAWSRDAVRFRPAGERERAAWQARWAQLLGRVQPVADDPALIARVARRLSVPSARQLEVQRRSEGPVREAREEGAPGPLLLRAPQGDARIAVEAIPLSVSFRARYPDALAVLERFEAGRLPAHIEALEIKRDHPGPGGRSGVWLHLDLTWFARVPLPEGSS